MLTLLVKGGASQKADQRQVADGVSRERKVQGQMECEREQRSARARVWVLRDQKPPNITC